MKVFPIYMNSLMKSAPLVGSTELPTDDRAHQRLSVLAMGVEDTQLLLYPRLLPLVTSQPTLCRVICSTLHQLIEGNKCLKYFYFIFSAQYRRQR